VAVARSRRGVAEDTATGRALAAFTLSLSMEIDYEVLDVILTVCERHDAFCMDGSVERLRLAFAIATALQEADLLASAAQ